jgi:hypothetical protein
MVMLMSDLAVRAAVVVVVAGQIVVMFFLQAFKIQDYLVKVVEQLPAVHLLMVMPQADMGMVAVVQFATIQAQELVVQVQVVL